jgi:hypothetical protein
MVFWNFSIAQVSVLFSSSVEQVYGSGCQTEVGKVGMHIIHMVPHALGGLLTHGLNYVEIVLWITFMNVMTAQNGFSFGMLNGLSCGLLIFLWFFKVICMVKRGSVVPANGNLIIVAPVRTQIQHKMTVLASNKWDHGTRKNPSELYCHVPDVDHSS